MNQDDWMKDDLAQSVRTQDFQPLQPEPVALQGMRQHRNRLIARSALALAVMGVAAALIVPQVAVSQHGAVPAAPASAANTASPSPTPVVNGAFPIGEWTPTADSGLPEGLYYPTIAWVGTEYLVLGGQIDDLATSDRYEQEPAQVAKAFDPAKNSWRDIAQPPSPYGTTRSWADGGLAVIGHQVYIASDYPGNTGSDCGEPYFISYDLDTDKWTELPLPAGELCAINYGGIYAVGDRIAVLASDWEDGNTKNGTQPDRVYDTKAKTWSDLPRDPVNVGGFNNQRRHAYVDGKQLVVVHFDDDESHSVIGAVSFLDPIGGTWSTPEETGITGVDKQREGWEYRCETVWSNGLITCFSVNSQQDPSTWPFYAFRLVSGTAKAKEVVAGQPSSPSSSFNFVEPGALLGLFAPTAGGRIMSITGQIISVPVYPGNYDYLHDPNNIIWAKPQDRGIGQGSILGHDRFMNGGKFYLFRYA